VNAPRPRYTVAMLMRKLAPLLLALGLSAAAKAATPVAIVKINATTITTIVPMSFPTVLIPSITPMSFPGVNRPTVIAPAKLPGVPSPLPLPVPAALLAKPFSAPSTGGSFLDWSFLDKRDDDGEETAGALVPADPGPKPMPPAGSALSALRDSIFGREIIRVHAVKPEQLFDGRKETARDAVLPNGKIL
jgi:hypothetical protein